MKDEIIRLEDVSKTFDGVEEILHRVSLSIKKNEFFTLLGPSGCGKTTILRIIGGFELPSEGSVYFDGIDITNLPPNKRELNTVFQKYALFPHLNVYDNISLGLKVRKMAKCEIERRVRRAAEILKLEEYLNRKPKELYGACYPTSSRQQCL